MQMLTELWQDAMREPHRVETALRDLVPDRDVIRSMFDEAEAGGLDFVVDSINRKHGRDTVTTAAARQVVDYLVHDRIPFGKPTSLR